MAKESVGERMRRAEDTTYSRVMEKLAADKNRNVRESVTLNRNAPVSVLKVLVQKEKVVAKNIAEKMNDWLNKSGNPV